MRRRVQLCLCVILIGAVLISLSAFMAHFAIGSPTDQSPIAVFTYSPEIPSPEQSVTFDASASYDPDGQIVQYTWNFGDGNVITLAGPIITHAYPMDGSYTVELTVTDNSGSTGVSVAVVQVQTVAFFRVCFSGTLIPMANVEVTAYYNDGSGWVKAPVGPHGFEIKYDNMTQPNLASTDAQRNRNPGYTAAILRSNASNIGFDIHPSIWTVFFKFRWGSQVAYWPNDTTRVYTYIGGVVEAHDYRYGHRAYWDPTASAYVIRVGDIPENGVCPTESHPIIVGILSPPPPPSYYLTVKTDPSGIATIPGEGWYTRNTNVTLTAPVYVNVSTTTRYRFNYWDADGSSQGAGVNSITVCMNANHTATAHYVVQCTTVFSQTGLSSDSTGTVVTVNIVPKTLADLPYTLWADNGSSVAYSYSSTVSSSASGKRYRLNSATGPASPITVTAPVTVTGNYVIQYLVTFAQNGLDLTATGTVVTVNSSAKIFTDLPFNWWVDCGSTVTYSYSSIVSSSVTDKQFVLTRVDCPPSQFVVTGPVTITGYYCIQYKITFKQSGLNSTATGTIVTVNGTSKIFSQLPYSFWVNSGTSVNYSYTSIVPSTVSGKQFRLSSVSGPTSPITVSAPVTVTGNYVAQCLVTFAQSGLDSSATGTIVIINSTSKTYAMLPNTTWVDNGSSITYDYNSIVSSSVSGKQLRLSSVSGPTSPITVNEPATITGCYVIQFYLTVSSPYGVTSGQGWYDSGQTAYARLNAGVVSGGVGIQYVFTSWGGDASGTNYAQSNPITMNGPKTAVASWKTQCVVTFAQAGLDSSASGTVVTVNGSSITYAQLNYTWWVDSGGTVNYSYSNVSSSTPGKQFVLTGVTGLPSPITVTSPVTVTGNYKTQYQVTFAQSGVGSDFTGTVVTIDSVGYGVSGLPTFPLFWWDKGSAHSFAFASPLTVNASRQYAWNSTSGLSTAQNGTLTIATSGSIVGNYIVQNCVTFAQVGVSSSFTGTVVVIDGTSYGVSALPASFYWQIGSVHNFSFQSPLVVAANNEQNVWTSTSGLSNLQNGSITITVFGSIVGNYKTQYYLTLATNPPSVTSPSGAGWYDSGTYATISTQQYVYGGSRYLFLNWTTTYMSEIAVPTSTSTTVLMDMGKTVTANYVHQYLVTFAGVGLDSSASGAVVTVNSVPVAYSQLPYPLWVDSGDSIIYSYSNVSSSTSGKRFILTGITGVPSPITVTTDTDVTGNYKTQYYLTVSSPYGTTGGQDWYDSGATAYATLNAGTVDQLNGTRRVFTNWNGDASGTNYAQSNPISMSGPKTALAQWKTQYLVTFAGVGLDSSASGAVVTVNSVPVAYSQLPYPLWVDSGDSIIYSYSNVSSSTSGKRFILIGVTGLPSPITITDPVAVTGDYKIQYQVTFSQNGVSNDFTGTIVTIDTATYEYDDLPTSFWWDDGSQHAFSFASPLPVNAGKQYVWASTSGLSTLQSDTLAVSDTGSVIGNYAVELKYQITYSQTGVGPDSTGTVVTVDTVEYDISHLSISFWWDDGSQHAFSFASPLNAGANKRYVWTSTTGLSTLQSESIIISASGSVIGNYKTQYYLVLATIPSGITSPSGTGWYDAGTNATISTSAFVDIVPGSSRYRFNGWTAANMTEIADPLRSPTNVSMDEAKTVTANYAVQYMITFNQIGVSSDFTGIVVTIDLSQYNIANFPITFWWDENTNHAFAYQSPLVVNPAPKRYVWTGTTGLSSSQIGSITVTTFGSIVGNYKTQYVLTVLTDPAGLSPQPTRNPGGESGPANGWWYDSATTVTLTAQPVAGYTFAHWDFDGSPQGQGVNPLTVVTGAPHTATAHYNIAWSSLAVSISPVSATIYVDQSVTLTSIVSGGIPPYGHQWYLGNAPASGATSNTWEYRPTTAGIYYVYLEVTDANGNTAQSQAARIEVVSVPVGGYSGYSSVATVRSPNITAYAAMIALCGAVLCLTRSTLTRRKRK